MSDSNAYINAYVDNSVSMLHEYVTMVLQLRTQLKVTSDILAEKDNVITELQKQVEQINQSRADASKWEQEYNSIKSRADHLETFANQVNEMKLMLLNKNKEIETLQKKIDNLTNPKSSKSSSPKKVINTNDKREEPIVMKEPQPEDKNDDF